ncbi:hypothetical protein AVEN_119804-1 [Araneus ventricosus]|uniref:Uncharacterized protein n=1 Tax=Araneus ventricosus TaxID=182803 RepID=A0A4Y2L9I0_ARAVE|nr:hypothetical protein AVEN_119804-1 [Araneus ventricosus]
MSSGTRPCPPQKKVDPLSLSTDHLLCSFLRRPRASRSHSSNQHALRSQSDLDTNAFVYFAILHDDCIPLKGSYHEKILTLRGVTPNGVV